MKLQKRFQFVRFVPGISHELQLLSNFEISISKKCFWHEKLSKMGIWWHPLLLWYKKIELFKIFHASSIHPEFCRVYIKCMKLPIYQQAKHWYQSTYTYTWIHCAQKVQSGFQNAIKIIMYFFKIQMLPVHKEIIGLAFDNFTFLVWIWFSFDRRMKLWFPPGYLYTFNNQKTVEILGFYPSKNVAYWYLSLQIT